MAKEFLTNIIIGGKVSPSLAKAINKANEQNKVLKKIGNAGKAIGKATLAASAATAAGVVAITKSAVESYAEYEQLVGGSQLMFGDAYSYVAEKAATAYKDVQMSQNEYLQQVNGFATGLKTALGGNEQMAAQLAHRIIKAEADVVAATGNTAENVQNAFNGIMKSNYTMLDNLQLGITPTKQGFQDLINKVNKWNASNGKLTKYTINNLADCQSALVDYIEMQGLAGYASNEAAGTIQGSLAMTKASWSNLVTGIADENADMEKLIDNFVESASALASNLLPKISVILKKIPPLITDLLPMLPTAIETLLPAVVDGVNSILAGVGSALPELIGSVVSAIGQIISQSFEQMPTPMLIIAGAIAALTAGITAYNAVVALKNIVDKVQETGIKKLITAQIAQNAAFLASPIFWIVAGVVALIAIFVVLWNKFEGFRNFWKTTWEVIKIVALMVWESIKLSFKLAVTFIMAIFTPIIAYFKMIWENIKLIFSVVGAVFRGDFQAAKDGIMQIFGNIGSWFKTVFESIKTAAQVPLQWLIGKFEIIKNGIEKVKDIFGWKGKETTVKAYATGGTVTRPHLAVVGDAPETIVPHGNTPRNRALLAEAARGVGGGIGGNNVNVTFAPVIYGGSGSEVKQAIRDSEIEFEQRMRAFMRKEGLVSYA